VGIAVTAVLVMQLVAREVRARLSTPSADAAHEQARWEGERREGVEGGAEDAAAAACEVE